MKSEKTIKRMFNDFICVHYEIIDKYLHWFELEHKKHGNIHATYKIYDDGNKQAQALKNVLVEMYEDRRRKINW